jgi:methylenetetrahydrofolate--tRNA-(uracil-5-)-methyltransferase
MALGSLVHYITRAESKNFQPANITFDLLPALDARIRDRKERHRQQCEVALRQFDDWYSRCIEQTADPSLRAG